MNSSVLVEIKSRQFSGEHPETEESGEILFTQAKGTCRKVSGIWCVLYEESADPADPAGSAVHTLLKISPSRLEVRKKGAIDTRFLFDPAYPDRSLYHTPFGSLEIRIITKEYALKEESGSLSLDLTYQMERGGSEDLLCSMQIQVRDLLSFNEIDSPAG